MPERAVSDREEFLRCRQGCDDKAVFSYGNRDAGRQKEVLPKADLSCHEEAPQWVVPVLVGDAVALALLMSPFREEVTAWFRHYTAGQTEAARDFRATRLHCSAEQRAMHQSHDRLDPHAQATGHSSVDQLLAECYQRPCLQRRRRNTTSIEIRSPDERTYHWNPRA